MVCLRQEKPSVSSSSNYLERANWGHNNFSYPISLTWILLLNWKTKLKLMKRVKTKKHARAGIPLDGQKEVQSGVSETETMDENSKILLDLETRSSCTSSIESRLRLCNNDDFLQSQCTEPTPDDTKPTITPIPKSQLLGKLKNFLPVISEANKMLQLAAMDNSKDFDIEALKDDSSAHIEMDLMLGVADLHTPEAISAAESATGAHQPVVPLDAADSSDDDDDGYDDDDSSNEDDGRDSSDDDDDVDSDSSDNEDDKDGKGDEEDTRSPTKLKIKKHAGDESSDALTNKKLGKRPKIVELS